MYIQCFIKKTDGSPVFVDYEGVRYIFQHNEFGDAVCFVGNQGHQRRLMKMGPANYTQYSAPEEANEATVLGAAPIPLGGRQKRIQTNPLPDGLSVDDALSMPAGDIHNPAGGPSIKPEATPEPAEKGKETAKVEEVDWVDSAKEAKVAEFKFLNGKKFKAYIDDNRGEVPGWPKGVQSALAKKINNLFPDEDPNIKGFNLDDFNG